MKWVVVARDALNAWLANDPDFDLMLEVLVWLDSLAEAGPPVDGLFDPSRETYSAEIGRTGIEAEYVVLPYIADPAIVVRSIR